MPGRVLAPAAQIDWRVAHSWREGYSDATAGREATPDKRHSPEAYKRGYEVGMQPPQLRRSYGHGRR
jgi:hypothetical protein